MATSLFNQHTLKEWEKILSDENMLEIMQKDSPLFRAMRPEITSNEVEWTPYTTGGTGAVPSGLLNTSTGVVPSHTHQYTSTQAMQPANRWSEGNLQKMLASRLGWDIDGSCPFKRVVPYKVSDEKIVIFVIAKGEALLFEDDAKLYPSDAFITQLRLLAEAQ